MKKTLSLRLPVDLLNEIDNILNEINSLSSDYNFWLKGSRNEFLIYLIVTGLKEHKKKEGNS